MCEDCGKIVLPPHGKRDARSREDGHIERFTSHKNDYLALDSLDKIYKLEELSNKVDLNEFVNEVVGSQFLDSGKNESGGFMARERYNMYDDDDIEAGFVYMEHSYYGLKTIELIMDFLDNGTISDSGINIAAFSGYIQRNLKESPDGQQMYFLPKHSSEMEVILENTYFAIDSLKMLDSIYLFSA